MSAGGLTLSAGGSGDLPQVMIAMREAFDPAFGEAWTEPQCAGILGMPGTWLRLAHVGDSLAGFALAREIAGESELLLLAVRPAMRGRGIGRALLASVVEEARARGAESLHLEVRSSNRALALYSAFGFHQVGVRPDYYRGKDGQFFDALTYRLEIPARA